MRDPARIKRILDKLEQAWLAAPDLRLGQFVNVIGWRATPTTDLFNTEDDRMEAALDAWLLNPPKYMLPKTHEDPQES